MKFNLCSANFFDPATGPKEHYYRVSLGTYVLRFFRLAFENLGHQFSATMRYVDPKSINIFVERFLFPEDAIKLKRLGYRYGLICTEPLDVPGLYNTFEFSEDVARANYEAFAISAQNAEFVWYLLDSARNACLSLNPNSHHLRYGHVPGYAELGDPAKRDPICDFYVSGAPTERRESRVNELRARGFVVAGGDFEPEVIHTNMLGRARATLSIQKTAAHSIFSVSRIHHAISNRVPILVEYDGPETYMSPYCLSAPPRSFIDAAAALVSRRDLPAHAQTMHDKMAKEIPMADILSTLLRNTFG